MILSAQTIRRLCQDTKQVRVAPWNGLNLNTRPAPQDPMITPFCERSVLNGKSYGLSSCTYDIRVANFLGQSNEIVDHVRMQNGDFVLASSIERVKIPHNICSEVKDKSSWAREGLAVQNTLIDPGFEGFVTLELSFHKPNHHIIIRAGDPICQLKFERLDEPTELPYNGKYQNQRAEPVEAIKEVVEPDNYAISLRNS